MKHRAITFFTLAEVAEALGISVKTVRRRIDQGELVAHMFGRSLRISDDDFRAYIALQRK